MFVYIWGLRKMDMLHILLWLIYPYSVVVIVGMALIWRINVPGEEHEGRAPISGRNGLLKRLVLGLVALCLITGIGVVLFYSFADEPEKLFIWVTSLLSFRPDLDLIRGISLLSRTHLLLLITLLLLLSLSKYSKYLWRPHLFFKKSFLRKDGTLKKEL